MTRQTPEQLLTIDYESFYSKDYSLSKMSTLDYIMDQRFQALCLAIKVNDQPSFVVKGDGSSAPKAMREALMDSGWERSLVVAHNNRFDAGISRFRLNMPSPAMYGCTRLIARAVVRPYVNSCTLKNVAEYYGAGDKGTQRETYLGYRLEDFSDWQIQDYMGYCAKDTDLCAAIFGKLINDPFPSDEMENIDIVLRMYLHPMFRLNTRVLQEHLAAVKAQKAALLRGLPAGVTVAELNSNPKFQQVLEALGAEVPMKWSEKQQKEAPAFAKTDPGFKELMENGSPEIQTVCAARIGVKSTLEETRTERLLNIGKRYKVLCVPLVYAGAHTLRYSGDEKINMQNPTRGSRIREAMEAPPDHEVTSADLAQIEARIAATLARCKRLMEAFADPDRDPYAEQAEVTFGVPGLTKETHPRERWIGKTNILQLQYASGAKKLKSTLAKGEGGKGGIEVSEREARQFVNTYRKVNWEIPQLWYQLDAAIARMADRQSFELVGGCSVLLGMFRLPNGILMPYRNLRLHPDTGDYVYDYGHETRKLYGGKFLENMTQALAALIVRMAMVRMYRRGVRTHLQVHDDITTVHHKRDREKVRRIMSEEMTRSVSWSPDLPIEVEIATGPNYLDVH